MEALVYPFWVILGSAENQIGRFLQGGQFGPLGSRFVGKVHSDLLERLGVWCPVRMFGQGKLILDLGIDLVID